MAQKEYILECIEAVLISFNLGLIWEFILGSVLLFLYYVTHIQVQTLKAKAMIVLRNIMSPKENDSAILIYQNPDTKVYDNSEEFTNWQDRAAIVVEIDPQLLILPSEHDSIHLSDQNKQFPEQYAPKIFDQNKELSEQDTAKASDKKKGLCDKDVTKGTSLATLLAEQAILEENEQKESAEEDVLEENEQKESAEEDMLYQFGPRKEPEKQNSDKEHDTDKSFDQDTNKEYDQNIISSVRKLSTVLGYRKSLTEYSDIEYHRTMSLLVQNLNTGFTRRQSLATSDIPKSFDQKKKLPEEEF